MTDRPENNTRPKPTRRGLAFAAAYGAVAATTGRRHDRPPWWKWL
jgi:hypothetical protein